MNHWKFQGTYSIHLSFFLTLFRLGGGATTTALKVPVKLLHEGNKN